MNSTSLCSLAGRYDNPIPPRFLAPIDSLKIPAGTLLLGIDSSGGIEVDSSCMKISVHLGIDEKSIPAVTAASYGTRLLIRAHCSKPTFFLSTLM